MCDVLGLLSDGPVDLGVGVAVDVGPDGGVSVEVSASLGVPEPDAFSVRDYEGLVLRVRPLALRCEGVPCEGFVCLDPAAGFGIHGKSGKLRNGAMEGNASEPIILASSCGGLSLAGWMLSIVEVFGVGFGGGVARPWRQETVPGGRLGAGAM